MLLIYKSKMLKKALLDGLKQGFWRQKALPWDEFDRLQKERAKGMEGKGRGFPEKKKGPSREIKAPGLAGEMEDKAWSR